MMTATLDFALEYIRRGWSVIPLLPRTKAPAIKLAPFLPGEMQMDEDGARMWWGTGDYGIAIITGRPSGLVVIDVDPRNGGDVEAVSKTLDDEVRLCAATGGGGMHFFCAYPEGASIGCGKTSMPGVDRKADGGYIVAAPSVHPNGELYRWGGPAWATTAPSTLPAWVTECATVPSDGAQSPSEPWIAATLAHPGSCKPGSQEDTLSRLSWWAAGHLDRDIADAILQPWLAQLPLGNPHDPWTTDQLDEKLDRAYEKRPPKAGYAGAIDQSKAPGRPLSTLSEREMDSWTPPRGADALDNAGSPPGSYPPFVEVADLVFPARKWVVEGFASSGNFTEIVGKVKKGKSTLVYQLAGAVLRGEPFLGRPVEKGGVVILTEQSGTSLQSTLERAGLLGARGVFTLGKGDFARLGGWADVVEATTELCRRTGIRLIIVDTLMRLASIGGDAENRADAVRILDPFLPAKALGVACVFVRHARKGQSGFADDIADAARGSSAVSGDMDIIFKLTPHNGSDLRILSCQSRITDDLDDIALQYEHGRYIVSEMPETARAVDAREQLAAYRAAREQLGPDASDRQIATELSWSPSTAGRYRKQDAVFTRGLGALPPQEDA